MDRNVLTNLIYADGLHLFGRLPGYEFIVLEEVIAEIKAPEQATALTTAFDRQYIRRKALSTLEALTLFAELTQTMGRGEAASLAAAATFGWSIACDEKRASLREARKLLGEGRILTTPGIFALAIRAAALTIDEANAIKKLLEAKRFRMSFASFEDVIRNL